MRVDEFLDRLDAVKPAGPLLWSARCPAHEDRNASMNVREHDLDGRILVKCHAGCAAGDIVSAMRLSMSDLFVERSEPAQRHIVHRPDPEPVRADVSEAQVEGWGERLCRHKGLLAWLWKRKGWTDGIVGMGVGFDGERLTLPVRDADGALHGVVRYAPGGSPKMRADRGTPRELWPPPEEMPLGAPLLLVEGEPDAISAMSLCVNAVAVPGAATWSSDWPQRFAGRRVVVMFDCDEPGRKAAARAASELSAVTWVRRIDLDPERTDGFDLGDLLLAQREKGQLDFLSNRLRRLLES